MAYPDPIRDGGPPDSGRFVGREWPPEEALDERTRRARAEPMTVRALGSGRYRVEVASGRTYEVDLPGGRCSCPDHRWRGGWCKHLRRVAQEISEGRIPPPGRVAVDCDACGRGTVVDEDAAPPHYCERCDLAPGDFVVDRRSGDLLVVAERPRGRADEVRVPGHDVTVAEYPGNEGVPDDDPVVEVLYPVTADDGEVEGRQLRTYRFPVSRLRRAGEAA